MKKIIILSLFFSYFNSGYNQISSNLDLEGWSTSGSYDVPLLGWATLNPIYDLTSLAPKTVFKTTDSYSGTYAAKLESGKIIGVNTFIGGLLATGYFDNSAAPGQNLKLGVPYTSSPTHIQGYYKYLPVGGDSADIFCSLTKWNSTTSSRDTLGWVGYRELNTVSTYTQFNLKIDYTDSITAPDTITILFSSSSGAANFQGQVGSTMYVDAISLPNPVGVYELISNDIKVDLFPNPSSDYMQINTDFNELINAEIYDANGKLVNEISFTQNTTLNLSEFNEGLYYLSLKDKKGLIASERFTVSK